MSKHREARLPLIALAAALALSQPMPGAATLTVIFAAPAAETPAFGTTEVVIAAAGSEAIARVELYFNGRRIGEDAAAPYVFSVDLGQENVDRTLRAVAVGVAGGRGEATLALPSLRVDEIIALRLQQLFVTVTRDGSRVLNLERGQFRVIDAGERQQLVTFERGEVPLTAALLVDASASMAGARLQAALRGARSFATGMAELDEAMLVLFSDRALLATDFTSEPAVFATALEQVQSEGGTALNDQLYAALLRLEARQGRRVVVVLSDGVDVDSVLDIAQVEEVAARSQALVYWIRLLDDKAGLGTSILSAWRGTEDHKRELEGLPRLVQSSGGRVLELPRVEEAEAAFRDILAELREQYVLGYYPSNARSDGRWHPVKIEIDGLGLSVRTRAGYRDS